MKHQVWSEGYRATCESSGATYHGEWDGRTFKESVKAFKDSQDSRGKALINLDRMTFWGCRFFDNQTDARKSFG